MVPAGHSSPVRRGRDTLSLWNQGAAEVVGVDISDQ